MLLGLYIRMYGSILFYIACIACWFKAIAVTGAAGATVLLITGAVIMPVGIVHGACAFLGYPWV